MILKELNLIEGKKERLSFILANKKAILKEKKSTIKSCPPIEFAPVKVTAKASGTSDTFEIIGNSIGFMDSHDDVSITGSFNKTVQESGQNVPILINHNHSPSGIFAKNLGVSIKNVSISELGFEALGNTEVLAAKIEPIYDPKMKELYANGEIKQHSVGIRYVKIELAINDATDSEGFANWNKYIPQVINREKADKNGYFFAVVEQQLLEISAVLWGSNPYTPTLQDKSLNDMKAEITALKEQLKALKEPPRHSDNEPLDIDLVTIFKNLN